MRQRRSRHAGPAPIRWQAYAIAALLLVAILFGGGGAEGPINNGVLQALAGVVLGLVFASHLRGTWPLASPARGALWLLFALLLIVSLQIVPLPPEIWQSLPGRDLARSALALVGAADDWRPLSLDTEATRRFAASLLMPAAIFFGLMGATRRELLLSVRAVLIAAGISALIGALQLTLGNPGWLVFYEGPNPGVASGIFANSNHHSTLLTGSILCLAFLIRTDRSRAAAAHHGHPPMLRNLHPAWIALPFLAVMTLTTGSRAGLILLGVAVIGAFLITLRGRSPLLWLGGLAGLSLVVAAAAFLSPSGNNLPIGHSFIFSDDSRYSFLPDVIYTFWQYWPWGSGLGTFVPVFAPNENLDVAGAAYVNHAHNDWLEWLIETGVPGALWLLVAFGMIVWRVVAMARKRADLRGSQFAAVIAGALILLIVALHSLVDYPVRMVAISAVTALGAALLFTPLTDAPPRPLASEKRPLWLLIAGGLLGLVVGVMALRIFAAEAAVRNDNGALAISLRPDNGRGLALAADAQWDARNANAARQLAIASVERAPLTDSAVRILALAAPNTPSAIAAWRIASAMGWRDRPTQLWAFQQALASGEFPMAAVRADAFLRTRSRIPQEYLAVVRTAAMEPRFRAALVERLKLRPTWRQELFDLPEKVSREELTGVYELLNALAADGNTSRGEANETLLRLVELGNFDPAVALYARVRGGDAQNGLLDDGEFDRSEEEYRYDSTPFDWRLFPESGSTVTIEERDGRHLFIATDGSKARRLVTRYIPLDPGSYRLEYRRGGEIDSPESVRVLVRCPAGAVGTSSTEELASNQPEPRRLTFSVGPDCPMVMLSIEVRAVGRPAEATFDGFSLRRLSGASSS